MLIFYLFNTLTIQYLILFTQLIFYLINTNKIINRGYKIDEKQKISNKMSNDEVSYCKLIIETDEG